MSEECAPRKRFNHLCAVAFEFESDNPSQAITDTELVAALQSRLDRLRQEIGEGFIQQGVFAVEETIDDQEED